MSTPRACRSLPALLAAGAAASLLPAVAGAQPLDHFKCYRTTDPPPEAVVLLKDQFDNIPGVPPDAAIVRYPVRFCTPVEKTDASGVTTPIQNPDAHLQLYLTGPSRLEPNRRVVIRNQFGRQSLITYSPELLAVPTAKNTQGFPDTLDHFKCYARRDSSGRGR
jgi:hypothetical protein